MNNIDDHFTQMLQPSKLGASKPSFISSTKFAGRKLGYYFSTGSKGIGYYLDSIQNDYAVAFDSKKRTRDVADVSNGIHIYLFIIAINRCNINKVTLHLNLFNVDCIKKPATSQPRFSDIDKLVESAEEADIAPLDPIR